MIFNAYSGKQNIGDYVYTAIKNRILDWELLPGQQLSEKSLSEELNVSRTPVRETFIKLAAEGLLEAKPYIGTFVNYIDMKDINGARLVRESLEHSVAEAACQIDIHEFIDYASINIKRQKECIQKGDYFAFHQLENDLYSNLYTVCDRELMWRVVSEVNSQFNRLMILCIRNQKNVSGILDGNKRLIESIKKKNAPMAKDAVNERMKKIFDSIDDIKLKFPEYFKSRD